MSAVAQIHVDFTQVGAQSLGVQVNPLTRHITIPPELHILMLPVDFIVAGWLLWTWKEKH